MTTPAEEAAAIIRSRCGAETIESAILLGRIFYGATDMGERLAEIPYAELPGFPTGAGVEDGALIIASVDGVLTAILKGRSTFHERAIPA